jgi:hypothetical protein
MAFFVWHYYFFQVCEMDNTIFHIDISALVRQGLNCWLEYVLSQPVDFDIPMMIQFMAEYLGLPIGFQFFINIKSIVSRRIFGDDFGKESEGLIAQEIYSYQSNHTSDSHFPD